MEKIVIIVLIVIIVISTIGLLLIPHSINIYKGLKFKKSKEKVHFMNVPKINTMEITTLIKKIKNEGTVLDGKLNNNNSKGRKITWKLLPTFLKTKFMTNSLLKNASNIIGEELNFAPETEQYRLFARLYQDEDDWLNYHYDNNFTNGKRYTVVIPLYYSSKNTSKFVIKNSNYEDQIIDIPIGRAAIYNGSEIYHKITKQTKNEKRLVLIIPLYTDYTQNIFDIIRQKSRNVLDKIMKL
tara:strand:+ start:3426 stop:4145 length:720 start_codon:yes stop_codon:yes gene_type:complete